MTWLTVTEYLYHKLPRICSICPYHNHNLFSFRLITGCLTSYPSRVPEFSPVCSGVRVARSLVFCAVNRCLLLFFAVILSILPRITVSDVRCGIFRPFLMVATSLIGLTCFWSFANIFEYFSFQPFGGCHAWCMRYWLYWIADSYSRLVCKSLSCPTFCFCFYLFYVSLDVVFVYRDSIVFFVYVS